MEKTLWIRLTAVLLIVGIVASVWTYGYQQAHRLKSPAVPTRSAAERRAALAALRTAWEQRPIEPTPDHARDEKDFINHTAFFVQKNFRHEIGPDAFLFYRHTVNDFFNRYGSEEVLAE